MGKIRKELDIDIIGGEELTEKESQALRDYFRQQKEEKAKKSENRTARKRTSKENAD